MPRKLPDLLQLASVGRPPVDDYLAHVANGGLDRFRTIIQSGGKAGQSLYSHVLDGVFVLDQLGSLLGLDDPALRCLFVAYTVHDLNKVPPYDEPKRPYNQIVTAETVAAEAEGLGLRAFFPGFDDYLSDIVSLARLHQGHLAVPADGLNRRRSGQYRLGIDAVERFGGLIRAADILALSHALDETRHKDRFLGELNAASPNQRYQLLTHRLAENRGLLTNLIHNVLVRHLSEKLGAVPIVWYPEGVAYLVRVNEETSWTDADTAGVAVAARERLAEIQREDLGTFIRGAPAGIKVDAAALESGATIEAILAILANRAQAKGYPLDWREQRERDLRADLGDVLPANFHLPGEPHLRQAELLSAYRILLDDHASAALRRLRTTAWDRVYDLIELPREQRQHYDKANSFRRAYLLANHVNVDFDALYAHVLADARPLFPAGDSPEIGDDYFAAYLAENLTVSSAERPNRALRAHLDRYIGAEHRQCSSCSAAFPTVELMKLNVPPSIAVQSFSNRLPGGVSREPKRNVCPVCRTQFVLERLAWVSHTDKYGGDLSTFYLHLFPYAFFTREQLAAWWTGVRQLRDADTAACYLDPGSYFREQRREPTPVLAVSKTKRNGLAIPQFSEAIGNTPTLALHAPGPSFSDQGLFALQNAAILARYFGCKVLLSRSAVPPMDGETVPGLLVDGLPRALRWLLPEDGVDAAGLAQMLDRLSLLHQLQDTIRQGNDDTNVVLALVRAAADDPVAVYFVADRLIERARRRGTDDTTTLAIRLSAPLLRQLILTDGRNPVEYLARMAQVAAESYLRGASFKRNSLLDPLDTALALTEQHPEPGDREDLRAAIVSDIFAHLERIADDEHRPGRTKREAVKRYVDLYVDGLIAQDHHGDVNRLLNRVRFIRSAYLFYLQEALDRQRQERAAGAANSVEST